MSLLALPEAAPTGRLARRNPAAKLVAAALPGVAAVVTLDAVTPALLLVAVVAAVPFSGVPVGALLRRSRPLLIAAGAVGVLNGLLTETQGGLVVGSLGPLTLSSEGALVGLGIALRVLAVALPGVLALASTDPVDLADSLVRQLRAPARFAYGALAALRLLPLVADEWRTLAMARRARGVAARGPLGALWLFAEQVLALLVLVIRRGTRLATAMDARGFDAGVPRTSARPQRVGRADLALVAAAAAVAVAATASSLALGTWRPLVG